MIPVFPLFVNGERQKKKGSLRRPSGMVYSFVALRGAFLGAGSALVKVLGDSSCFFKALGDSSCFFMVLAGSAFRAVSSLAAAALAERLPLAAGFSWAAFLAAGVAIS